MNHTGDARRSSALTGPELRGRGLVVLKPCTIRLQDLCSSHEQILKQQAAVALGKIGDPESIDALFGLLEDDEEVAEETARALARLDVPDVISRFLGIMVSSTPRIQGAIAAVLADFSLAEDVRDALVPLVASSHPNVRKAALRSIGSSKSESIRSLVIEAMQDDVADVVVEAVRSFAAACTPDGDDPLDVLEPVYEKAADARIKASIVACLRGRSGDRLVAFFKKALRDANPRVRANAVEALADAGISERRLMSIVKPMIQEGENNRVLANVAIALGGIDFETTLSILSRLLNSPEKWERASAVYAARFIRSDRVAAWLTTLFTSEEDPDVLRNILESLSHFDADEVSACFVKALEHDNPLVRSGAAGSLGRIQDPSIQNELVSLLERENDTSVLCEILTALGSLSDASRIPLVARFLQHTDIRVQANAIEALACMGTVEIVPYVEPFLNSSDNRVKANAAVALWSQGSLDVVTALHDMLGHTNLKQRSSAVYAVGELGQVLRHLTANPDTYYLLSSALKEEEFASFHPLSSPGSNAGTQKADSTTARDDHVQVALPQDEDDDEQVFPFAEIEEYFQYLSKRRVKEALELLSELLEAYPKNRLLLYLKADSFRLQKALSRACEGFRELTDDQRHGLAFLNPHIHLANIYSQTHELPQSLKAYFTAAKAQLVLMSRQIDMGLQLLEDKRVDDASLLLKEIISAMPLNSKIHYAAGRSFLKGKYNEEAYRNLRLAYLINPNNGEVLLSLAFACYKTRRYDVVRLLAAKLERLFGGSSPLSHKAAELVRAMDEAGV